MVQRPAARRSARRLRPKDRYLPGRRRWLPRPRRGRPGPRGRARPPLRYSTRSLAGPRSALAARANPAAAVPARRRALSWPRPAGGPHGRAGSWAHRPAEPVDEAPPPWDRLAILAAPSPPRQAVPGAPARAWALRPL